MAVGYAGGFDTYVPTLELSGNLLVAFGRDLKKYPVNRYSRVTPVTQRRGAFLRFDPLSIARFPNVGLGNRWALGTNRPISSDELLGFTQYQFQTIRYNYGIPLDSTAVDVANWPVMKMHSEALAQRAMTEKSYVVTNTIFTQSNYASTHTVSASTAGGGFLESGSTANRVIKKVYDYCARLIQQDTLGSVRWSQLTVLMNHNTALRLGATRELGEYVMQQAGSEKLLSGEGLGPYAIPAQLYNYQHVIEDTFYNTYNDGNASAVPTVVVPDNQLAIIVSDGPQEQPEGGRSYNTCHVFAKEEFSTEAFTDNKNRINELHVTMDYDTQIVSPPSGVIVTNLFS